MALQHKINEMKTNSKVQSPGLLGRRHEKKKFLFTAHQVIIALKKSNAPCLMQLFFFRIEVENTVS